MAFNYKTIEVGKVSLDQMFNKASDAISFDAVNIGENTETIDLSDMSSKMSPESFKLSDAGSNGNIDINSIINNQKNNIDKKYENEKLNIDYDSIDDTSYDAKGHKFVNYYQFNYNQHYGYGTISSDGCGPTSMAMVLTYLLGKEIDPVECAEFGDGPYTAPEGTCWNYFEAIAEKYDVECHQKEISEENIRDGLKDGNPVIVIMDQGDFTTGGHFIVLRSIDEKGQITIADPASKERESHIWDVEKIVEQGLKIWVFPKEKSFELNS